VAERFLVEIGLQKSEKKFQVSIFFFVDPFLTLKFSKLCTKLKKLFSKIWIFYILFGL